MGDRTSVTLVVLNIHAALVEPLAKAYGYAEKDSCDEVLTEYLFDEVNYADLGFEKELRNLLIPYDKSWGDGGEYTRGQESFRVLGDTGEVRLTEFYGDYPTIALSDVGNILNQSGITEDTKMGVLREFITTANLDMVAPFTLDEQLNNLPTKS